MDLSKTLSFQRRRLYTAEEDALLRQLSKDHTLKQAAFALGRSVDSVKSYSRKNFIFFVKVSPRWTNQEDLFLKAHLGEMTANDIGVSLGRSIHSVRNRIFKLGLCRTYVPVKVYPNDDSDVELCRQLFESGLSIRVISEKMDIPRLCVYRYVTYQSRISIPDFY